MAFRREQFGRDLRTLLEQRRLSYREVQQLTGVAFSQVGDLCAGLVRTRAQIEKLVAGLGLDAGEWLPKAGFVPDGPAGDPLLQALLSLGDVGTIGAAALARPAYERVSAGPGALPPDAPIGTVADMLAPHDYVVCVRGDSMSGVLEDGDWAFVKRQEHASPGDLVVALVRDSVVVKRLKQSNGMVTLASANDRYEEIPASDLRILGVVTGFYRLQ